MAGQSAPVEPHYPPKVVLRAINPIMRMLLQSPFGGPIRSQIMVLRFTGRKTGRRYQFPVAAHRIDDLLYSLTAAPWARNFRGGADAELVLEGKTLRMRGELLDDPDVVAPLYRRRIADLGRRAQRQLGIKINTPGMPSTEAIAESARRYHFIAIRFTPKS